MSRTHRPPKVVRRQIEKRYRTLLRQELQKNRYEEWEGVTPPKWIYGIGWFWGW